MRALVFLNTPTGSGQAPFTENAEVRAGIERGGVGKLGSWKVGRFPRGEREGWSGLEKTGRVREKWRGEDPPLQVPDEG